MSINIQLPKFEGPLGLLLYLIRKEEMDIMDIKIHEITKQYFEYIKLMKELDLEVAGEFVAMASTLIHIKSRMLLPQYDENGEIVETEDPRKELVQKLLEYQKYQEAAKMLYDRPLLGRDLWVRGVRETLAPKEDEIILEENALFSLIATYRKVVKTAKKKIHQVTAKAQSISSRILEIKDRLFVGQKVVMMDLVTVTEDRARQALITFLSLLELGKMGFVSLFQTEVYSDIYVEARKPIEGDVLSSVEEYGTVNADAMAEQMFAKAEKEAAEEAAFEEAQSAAGASAEDFVLKDAEDNPQMVLTPVSADQIAVETVEITEDMASDEEIFAAEEELFKDDTNDGNVEGGTLG
ncbi:segregation and condensation protein A [Bdellovibrio sp. HCB337]|uniref:segregation and condensation protein A n=1 Tax=Bdellovibrio sp. HCB337 TaxID=3394358 RepID=UPI0039A53E02